MAAGSNEPKHAMPKPTQPTGAGTTPVQLRMMTMVPTNQKACDTRRSVWGGSGNWPRALAMTKRSPHSGQTLVVTAVRLYPHLGHRSPVSSVGAGGITQGQSAAATATADLHATETHDAVAVRCIG